MAPLMKIDHLIENIDKLPPFPETTKRVLTLADNPDVDFKEIVDVIKYDQAITTNCLRLCNSSYFGLTEKVFSIDHALTILGLQNIVKIVLADCSALSIFQQAQKGYDLKPGELWRHSVACALLSQMLRKKTELAEDSILFTAALLHDIGKLVLDRYISKNKETFHTLLVEERRSLIEAEKEVFGINHAEFGGLIAKKWNFPNSIINSIKNHHGDMLGQITPNLESWVRLSNLVYHYSEAQSIRINHPGIECHIHQDIVLQFRLRFRDIKETIAQLPLEMKKTAELMQLPQ